MTKIGTEIAHVTRDSDTTFKVQGQGHQAALLSAALTRKAAAAVSVGTYMYLAWESTVASARRRARRLGAHGGGGEGRGILCRQAHSVLTIHLCSSGPFRWMCGVKLNERKKSEELGELLGLEPVSLMIKKSRLRWFGHVERKDDNDWVKRCITWEVEGIRQRGRLKKVLVGLC